MASLPELGEKAATEVNATSRPAGQHSEALKRDLSPGDDFFLNRRHVPFPLLKPRRLA